MWVVWKYERGLVKMLSCEESEDDAQALIQAFSKVTGGRHTPFIQKVKEKAFDIGNMYGRYYVGIDYSQDESYSPLFMYLAEGPMPAVSFSSYADDEDVLYLHVTAKTPEEAMAITANMRDVIVGEGVWYHDYETELVIDAANYGSEQQTGGS